MLSQHAHTSKTPPNNLQLRYHPHRHGSTTLQTTTLHGALVVEDDNAKWLPAAAGCAPVAAVFAAAKDVVLDFELLPFWYFGDLDQAWNARISGGSPAANNTDPSYGMLTDISNHQFVSNISRLTVCLC